MCSSDSNTRSAPPVSAISNSSAPEALVNVTTAWVDGSGAVADSATMLPRVQPSRCGTDARKSAKLTNTGPLASTASGGTDAGSSARPQPTVAIAIATVTKTAFVIVSTAQPNG